MWLWNMANRVLTTMSWTLLVPQISQILNQLAYWPPNNDHCLFYIVIFYCFTLFQSWKSEFYPNLGNLSLKMSSEDIVFYFFYFVTFSLKITSSNTQKLDQFWLTSFESHNYKTVFLDLTQYCLLWFPIPHDQTMSSRGPFGRGSLHLQCFDHKNAKKGNWVAL